jgi:hypothetical protein
MKYIKLFENFEVVEPIKYGDPLNPKEIKFLEGYNIMCPQWILKDDGYYYVFDHRCEKIKDVPLMYIHAVCSKFNIQNYTINDDFTIDVDGDVNLSLGFSKHRVSTKIPLKFNKTSGYFACQYKFLTTLEGSPKEVGGSFFCSGNELTSLKGGPKRVSGNFVCSHNQLTSLEGAPEYVGGNFNCHDNTFRFNQLMSTEYEGTIKGKIIYIDSEIH